MSARACSIKRPQCPACESVQTPHDRPRGSQRRRTSPAPTRRATPRRARRCEAVRARIEAWEPTINALWHRDDAEADRQAVASEERWRAGEPLSPLDGVPVTIKENITTAGVPSPLGSAATTLAPAPRDAPAAARLREAGAVLVAKTTMPDFGMLTSGVSTRHGTTRSPWNPDVEPRRLELGRRRRHRRGLRADQHRHRHRRIGAPARCVHRRGRPQAELRTRTGESAVLRPRGRPAHPDRRRRRARDVRPGPARRRRLHEPAAAGAGLGGPGGSRGRRPDRAHHRRRRGHADRSRGGARRGVGGHHPGRGRGPRRADRAAHHRRDAQRSGPLLADAQPARPPRPAAGEPGADAALPARVDGRRRGPERDGAV